MATRGSRTIEWARIRVDIRMRSAGLTPRPVTGEEDIDDLADLAGEPMDAETAALIEALAILAGERSRAKWDPAKHPRIPRGQPGGGRFVSLANFILPALKEHVDGLRDGDPFEGFDRNQLRRVAKARGIRLRRGISREEIADLILADVRVRRSRLDVPGVGEIVPPRAPRVPRAPRAPRAPGIPPRVPRGPRGPDVDVPEDVAQPGPQARSYHRNLIGLEDLANVVEGGNIKEEKALAGGVVGDTRFREYADGTKVVYKRGRPFRGIESKDQADAEQLASLVARTLGLNAPRIYRNSDEEVNMDFVDAQVAHVVPHDKRAEVVALDEGMMIGLLDLLIKNGDRHEGNWMVTRDGRPVPIDHGLAFARIGDPRLDPKQVPIGISPFSEHYANWGSWKENKLTKRDVQRVRTRLGILRADFEHLGRVDWYEFMLARLDVVGRNAKGGVSRLPPMG